MNLYEPVTVYHRYTGRPVGVEYVPYGKVCDFCGKRIEEEFESTIPEYKVVETGDIEETWCDDELIVHTKMGKAKIDLRDLYSKHDRFHYCFPFDKAVSCEREMLSIWSDKVDALSSMMQEARYDMLKHVIGDEKYSLEDFDLTTAYKMSWGSGGFTQST